MNQYLISQLAKAHGRKILALNLAFNHPRTPYFKEKNRPIDRYKQMSISTQIKLINNQEKVSKYRVVQLFFDSLHSASVLPNVLLTLSDAVYTETVEKQSGNFGGEVQAIVIRDTDSECSSQTSEEDLSIITENPNCKRNLSTLKKKQTNRKKKHNWTGSFKDHFFFFKTEKSGGFT